MNLYSYVRNDPVNSFDPSGLNASALMDSGFCSAQYSFEECGGWGGIYGGYFGDGFAEYNRVYGGLSEEAAEALRQHLERVGNAFAGKGYRTNEEVERNESSGSGGGGSSGGGQGSNLLHEAGHLDQQNQQQNQPLASVTVLGNNVGITYDPKLSIADQLIASNAIAAGVGLINKNASSLTADEKKAIGEITKISVVVSGNFLGATGNGTMTLSLKYIQDSSAAWLGSLFGHEGQHYLNKGKYSGANLWKDEQSAGSMQLGIGNKIGFKSYESTYLQKWIDPSNQAAMQNHMTKGSKY